MTITLMELAARDEDVRFSPFVWRTRMMLLHKGLTFERVPWHFTDRQMMEKTGHKTVPVIHDNGCWTSDSLTIAEYLDDSYPDKPLFDGPQARRQARLINGWLDGGILMRMFPMIAVDVVAQLSSTDQAYFRTTREKFFGCTLEQAAADRERKLPELRKALTPARRALGKDAFMAGDAPGWMDYALFGTLMWPHCISRLEILEPDDLLVPWFARMLALFDGHAAAAKRAV